MAFTLSFKNSFERQSPDALRADRPMDAGYVWTLIDNVGHMVDECGKYRVNWFGNLTSEGDHYALSTSTDHVLPIWFPTLIISPTQYPRYDVRVALNAPGVFPIRVSLVTPLTQAPITGLDAGVIGTFTGDTVVGSTWIEGLIENRSTEQAPLYALQAPVDPSIIAVVGTHHFIKLLIEGVAGSSGIAVIGVQVREFSK